MPTYAYGCKSCGHQFEEWQKISEESLVICPSCKEHTLVRVIGGGAGLIFKGSGFYLTDYKKEGSKGKTGEEDKKTDKPSESKTTKPSKS